MRWCIRCTKVTYRNNSINSFSLSYGIFLTKPLQIIVQKILICFIAVLTIALIQFVIHQPMYGHSKAYGTHIRICEMKQQTFFKIYCLYTAVMGCWYLYRFHKILQSIQCIYYLQKKVTHPAAQSTYQEMPPLLMY